MAVYTQLQEGDIQEIADSYDLTIANYETIATGASNSNYLLRTQRDKYVLTVFDEKTFDQVVELGQLLLLLIENEFPTTPPLIATNGEIAIMHKDKPVMLKVYIAGQIHRYIDKTLLHQVGVAMAKLHQVSIPDFLSNRQTYGLEKFSSIQDKNIDTAYEAWITKRLPYLEQIKPQELPQGLIHGDLFYDNVLFEDARLKAIIDFEDAVCAYRVFDLGMAIIGLCRRSPIVVLEKARALIKGYEQIRVLEQAERGALQFFVEYAATAVSCWRYWKYYIDTPNVDKADKHWRMMRVAEMVRNIPKGRFMDVIF